jgi:hypothetical protein
MFFSPIDHPEKSYLSLPTCSEHPVNRNVTECHSCHSHKKGNLINKFRSPPEIALTGIDMLFVDS